MPLVTKKKKKKPKERRRPQARAGGPGDEDNVDGWQDHHPIAHGPQKSGPGPSQPSTVSTEYGCVSREILKQDCAESPRVTSCPEQPPEVMVKAQLKPRVEDDYRDKSPLSENQDNLLQQEEETEDMSLT